jgi:hypothetical protein
LTGQFTKGLQRVEQHGNEKNTSTSESTGGRLGQVVETTSSNKGDGDAGEMIRNLAWDFKESTEKTLLTQ